MEDRPAFRGISLIVDEVANAYGIAATAIIQPGRSKTIAACGRRRVTLAVTPACESHR